MSELFGNITAFSGNKQKLTIAYLFGNAWIDLIVLRQVLEQRLTAKIKNGFLTKVEGFTINIAGGKSNGV